MQQQHQVLQFLGHLQALSGTPWMIIEIVNVSGVDMPCMQHVCSVYLVCICYVHGNSDTIGDQTWVEASSLVVEKSTVRILLLFLVQ